MRVALAMLLLASASFAQSRPDFSGIFLRTETRYKQETEPAIPRILDIKQTANEIVVSATQNRETAVVHYSLSGKSKDGLQVKLKGKDLVIQTISALQIPWAVPGLTDPQKARLAVPAGTDAILTVSQAVEERWELSGDGQQLTIRTKVNGSDRATESFRREPSLDSAIAAASAGTRKNCNNIKRLLTLKEETSPSRKYETGADLGVASVHAITRCTWYGADLSGDAFKHLEKIKDAAGTHFTRNNNPVRAFDNDLVLEVLPHPSSCSQVGTWTATGPPPPEMSLRLRFAVRWTGEMEKELGEVKSEFLYEPWREWNTPVAFYRMRIPAQDVPLTDELEITISSEAGEELACIKGHI